MEERLSVLKSTFGSIVDLKESNINILHTLQTRIQKLKQMYSDFIQSNREQLFVFTLDSFHFQSKLVDLEYEDMSRMFLSITNRMYCDYYKLFKIIVEYINENIPDKKLAELIKVHDNYPIYKDLEPFKQYDFQHIQSVHEVLLVILTYLHTHITNKEHDLKVYQTKNQIGLHIDSFVNTFSFNNIVMQQKVLLFITYMEFFHKSHTKYLKRFIMKVNLMLSQLNNDIKLDNPAETKTTKKEMMADLKDHHLDKELLSQLKVSISDEQSTNSMGSRTSSDANDVLSPIQIGTAEYENVSELTEEVERKKTPRFRKSPELQIEKIIEESPQLSIKALSEVSEKEFSEIYVKDSLKKSVKDSLQKFTEESVGDSSSFGESYRVPPPSVEESFQYTERQLLSPSSSPSSYNDKKEYIEEYNEAKEEGAMPYELLCDKESS
jgi:hypothetical protein